MRAAAVLALALSAQTHQHGAYGTVTFANSCAAAAQPPFARGMALLHSFEFGPAIEAFTDAAAQDPSCGIALWGVGLAQWSNPFSVTIRPAAVLQAGRDTLQKAAAAGAKTERERDYIAALTVLYAGPDGMAQPARLAGYRDAMAKLHAKYASVGSPGTELEFAL